VGGAQALFLPFFKGGGPEVGWGWGAFCGGGLVPGWQGWGLTLDVTGHVWMLGDQR